MQEVDADRVLQSALRWSCSTSWGLPRGNGGQLSTAWVYSAPPLGPMCGVFRVRARHNYYISHAVEHGQICLPHCRWVWQVATDLLRVSRVSVADIRT